MSVDFRKTPRSTVYWGIDGERDYQDTLPPTRTDGLPRTVGDYVTMMQAYQADLVEAWRSNPGDLQALDVMRKLAGIAVRCMEDHGVVQRGGNIIMR